MTARALDASAFSAGRFTPGTVREGEWLIGHGMAASARGNLFGPSAARVRIQPDGQVVIESEMTDIGTGTYTILAQIAADLLGVSFDRISVRLGDTGQPRSAGSGGSWGAATAGSSVYAACSKLREMLAEVRTQRDDAMEQRDKAMELADRHTRLLVYQGEQKAPPGPRLKLLEWLRRSRDS